MRAEQSCKLLASVAGVVAEGVKARRQAAHRVQRRQGMYPIGRGQAAAFILLLGSLHLLLFLGSLDSRVRAEDRPLLGVLLMEDCRAAEVLHKLLVTLEARIADGRCLGLSIAYALSPEAALDHHEDLVHISGRDEIDEGKTSRDVAVLLARHVEEGEPVCETTLLHEHEELLASAVPNKISHHHGGAGVFATLDPVRINVVLGEFFHADLRPLRTIASLRLPLVGVRCCLRLACINGTVL
mmetsp:Transcript_58899/g.110387  ORF Transcript_58899/g.110387 Transcript_58899/m.110387 type:complete len:241 (-) Transcript_58899:689-1411(-)